MAEYRKKVCYFYDPDVGNYHFGYGHPMKPTRIRMTHDLLLNYGLYKKLKIYRPWRASALQLSLFHSDGYVSFLREINKASYSGFSKQFAKYHVSADCPIFNGLYDFCQIAAGGSIAGALKLNSNEADIAINWAGGLHHAKKNSASGFCYVNDIVLAILELLRYHERVLYIDIDVHHGDGVEEAFYTTSRVLTLSLHKFGDFFPGSGDFKDVGKDAGQYYSLNLPLRDGMTDDTYAFLFKPILRTVIDWYRPGAIVMQCGADSLVGDRLGVFNLSLQGHGYCVEYAKSFGIPLLLVGGGGYTIKNVSRCWCNETAIAIDAPLQELLPYTDYLEYYSPNFTLNVPSSLTNDNKNTKEYLESLLAASLQNLKNIQGVPENVINSMPFDNYGQSYKYGILAEDVAMIDEEVERIHRVSDINPVGKKHAEVSDTRAREYARADDQKLLSAIREVEITKIETKHEKDDIRMTEIEKEQIVENDNEFYDNNEKTDSHYKGRAQISVPPLREDNEKKDGNDNQDLNETIESTKALELKVGMAEGNEKVKTLISADVNETSETNAVKHL